MKLRRLHTVTLAEQQALAAVLLDCVEGGASVGFMSPLTPERALAFWHKVAGEVAAGERALLVVEEEGESKGKGGDGIVGTVQLVLAQPDNQPHRADLSKMLVMRRARRHGWGARLMQAAEDLARECGKTLLVLDTASDEARRLYERQGWVRCGEIPGFALLPQGGLCATALYYRDLPPELPPASR